MSISAVRIERVEACQSGLLEALHGQCFDEAWSSESIATLLSMPGCLAMIAHAALTCGEAEQPMAFLLARDNGDEWEILSIGVLPDCRRRGVARALIAEMTASETLGRSRQVVLEVAADNIGAQLLYKNMGFQQVGRRPRYYRRAGPDPVDALILRRNA